MFDASVAPAPPRSRRAAWLRFVVRDAILGDAPGRLLIARHAVPLVAGLTGLYVVVSLLWAETDIAVPFAIVPLALAAFLMPAAWWIASTALTYVGVFLAEEVVLLGIGLVPLEAVELVAFGLVALGLRIVVARLVLGREALYHQAAELAYAQ